MKVDVTNELLTLENARNNLFEKLSSYFKDKWTLALNYAGCRFNNGFEPGFLKNKEGKYIAFKIEKCRPKSAKLLSEDLLDEIVLEGTDDFGKFRCVTLQTTGFIRNRATGATFKAECYNKEIHEYEVPLFESCDEAVLYATLHDQLSSDDTGF